MVFLKIENVEILELELPLKFKFSHFLKSRNSTKNIILKIHSKHNFGIGESLPREYLTSETPEDVFATIQKDIYPYFKNKDYEDFESVIEDIKLFLKTIKKNQLSAFAAFETALVNLAAKHFSKGIEDILNHLKIKYKKKEKIRYSAIIGDSNMAKMALKAKTIDARRFKDVKVKALSNSSLKLKLIRSILKNVNLRVDANCAFNLYNIEDFISLLSKLEIEYLEQPFKVCDKKSEEIHKLCKDSGIKIILDESFVEFNDYKNIFLKNIGDTANLRISKNGGIINLLLLYKVFQKNNTGVVFGCLVGESVLTRYNIILSQYLDTIFNEGDYDKFLFKKPIFKNPDFGKDGILKTSNYDLDFNDDIENYENYILKREIF